jgi:DNA-binding CsgD family transcriptional regulator
MNAESPTPHLPRGAGGPLPRVAGRGPGPVAFVLEPDPLARYLVVPAVAALGFAVVPPGWAGDEAGASPAAVFVSLERLVDCRRAREQAATAARAARPPSTSATATPGAGQPFLVVGYGACSELLLSAHRAHGCCDLIVRLDAPAGQPRLLHLPPGDAAASAGLSAREADVLVLLLRGLTTRALAARLCVSENTARSHCRAVLRKLGFRDRRALRAGSPGGGSQVRPPATANFAEEWGVAARRPSAHT